MDKQLIERLCEIAADVGKNYCSPDGDLIDKAADELENLLAAAQGERNAD